MTATIYADLPSSELESEEILLSDELESDFSIGLMAYVDGSVYYEEVKTFVNQVITAKKITSEYYIVYKDSSGTLKMIVSESTFSRGATLYLHTKTGASSFATNGPYLYDNAPSSQATAYIDYTSGGTMVRTEIPMMFCDWSENYSLSKSQYQWSFDTGRARYSEQRELIATINQAEALDSSLYHPDSFASLTSALSVAQPLTTGFQKRTDVFAARDNVLAAISNLQLKPNTDELLSLIEQVKQINPSNWTSASWEALQAAIAYAEQVAENRLSASEIEDAQQRLQSAIDSLKSPPPEFIGGIPADSLDMMPSAFLSILNLLMPVALLVLAYVLFAKLIPRIIRDFSKG